MLHEALGNFVAHMDALAAHEEDSAALAAGARQHLGALLESPEFLEERHRRSDAEHYRQHVVHVHPEGKYSLVSLVWLPGQQTPVHDHRCWCVVGVLEGVESETRYRLLSGDEGKWLASDGSRTNAPGDISTLVPPQENIHRVANACEEMTVSLHVYGADIATLGTSVNQVFHQEIRDDNDGHEREIAWRAGELTGQLDSSR